MNHQPHRTDPQMWDPEATEVLPPAPGAYPSLEATRALPRIEDDPPLRPAARRKTRGGPPTGVLVAVAIAACAAAGLAIGAVLGDDGDGTGDVVAAQNPATTATATPTPSPTPTPAPTEPPIPTGQYVLLDPATGRAADVQAASPDDGAPVIAWERHAQPNQQWFLSDLGDGHVQIKAAHSGLCLQAADPVSPGAVVVQRPCIDADAQRWQPTASADAAIHTLTLKGWGLVLATAGPENGAPLTLQAPDPANPRGWTLQPVA